MIIEGFDTNLDAEMYAALGKKYLTLLRSTSSASELRKKEFLNLEKKLVSHFLKKTPEYTNLSALLKNPNDSASQIAKLVAQIREKVSTDPYLKEPGTSVMRLFPEVITDPETLFDRGFLPMTGIEPIPVPFIYHTAPESATQKILSEGILPSLVKGEGRSTYAYLSFLPNTWTNWAKQKETDSGKVSLFRVKVSPETLYYTWAPRYYSEGDGRVDFNWAGTLVTSDVLPLETIMGYKIYFDLEKRKKQNRSQRLSKKWKRWYGDREEWQRPIQYDNIVWEYSAPIGKEVPPHSLTTWDDERTEILVDFVPPSDIELVTDR